MLLYFGLFYTSCSSLYLSLIDSPNYDSLDGCYAWALETLRTHSKDKRDYVYSLEEFERGETYDDLWNAAQLQMVEEGKMHVRETHYLLGYH